MSGGAATAPRFTPDAGRCAGAPVDQDQHVGEFNSPVGVKVTPHAPKSVRDNSPTRATACWLRSICGRPGAIIWVAVRCPPRHVPSGAKLTVRMPPTPSGPLIDRV